MKRIVVRVKSSDEWRKFFTKHGFSADGLHFKVSDLRGVSGARSLASSEKVRKKGKR